MKKQIKFLNAHQFATSTFSSFSKEKMNEIKQRRVILTPQV